MLRGCKLPTFYDWNDPSSSGRQNRSLIEELQALWATLDERATTVVVPAPTASRNLHGEYLAAFGEHVMVSPSTGFIIRLPWATNQDEGRSVVVSRDRVEHAIIVLVGTQPPGAQVIEPRQTINGVEAYLLPTTLSPMRFRVFGRNWRV